MVGKLYMQVKCTQQRIRKDRVNNADNLIAIVYDKLSECRGIMMEANEWGEEKHQIPKE